MQNAPHFKADRAQLFVWWIIWGAILSALIVIYLFLGRRPVEPAAVGKVFPDLAGLIPLFVSIVIRWLVLPRYTDATRALPLFVVGLALAEACGILGIFLGGPYRDDLFVLGVLGVLQFAPLFVGKMTRPAGSNFRVNP
jgi:hypothetical protein